MLAAKLEEAGYQRAATRAVFVCSYPAADRDASAADDDASAAEVWIPIAEVFIGEGGFD